MPGSMPTMLTGAAPLALGQHDDLLDAVDRGGKRRTVAVHHGAEAGRLPLDLPGGLLVGDQAHARVRRCRRDQRGQDDAVFVRQRRIADAPLAPAALEVVDEVGLPQDLVRGLVQAVEIAQRAHDVDVLVVHRGGRARAGVVLLHHAGGVEGLAPQPRALGQVEDAQDVLLLVLAVQQVHLAAFDGWGGKADAHVHLPKLLGPLGRPGPGQPRLRRDAVMIRPEELRPIRRRRHARHHSHRQNRQPRTHVMSPRCLEVSARHTAGAQRPRLAGPCFRSHVLPAGPHVGGAGGIPRYHAAGAPGRAYLAAMSRQTKSLVPLTYSLPL